MAAVLWIFHHLYCCIVLELYSTSDSISGVPSPWAGSHYWATACLESTMQAANARMRSSTCVSDGRSCSRAKLYLHEWWAHAELPLMQMELCARACACCSHRTIPPLPCRCAKPEKIEGPLFYFTKLLQSTLACKCTSSLQVFQAAASFPTIE